VSEYRAGVMGFADQLLDPGDDVTMAVGSLLPPEHKVAAVKHLADLDHSQVLLEGPLLPVVLPDKEPGPVDIVMTQDFDEPAQMMRWYGEFSIGRHPNGEPITTRAWLIMECSYARWNEWRRRGEGQGMLNALFDPSAREMLTRPAKTAGRGAEAERSPPRVLH
jgi:hypothetical protein